MVLKRKKTSLHVCVSLVKYLEDVRTVRSLEILDNKSASSSHTREGSCPHPNPNVYVTLEGSNHNIWYDKNKQEGGVHNRDT